MDTAFRASLTYSLATSMHSCNLTEGKRLN